MGNWGYFIPFITGRRPCTDHIPIISLDIQSHGNWDSVGLDPQKHTNQTPFSSGGIRLDVSVLYYPYIDIQLPIGYRRLNPQTSPEEVVRGSKHLLTYGFWRILDVEGIYMTWIICLRTAQFESHKRVFLNIWGLSQILIKKLEDFKPDHKTPPSWWFQPIWKILVKMDLFPR